MVGTRYISGQNKSPNNEYDLLSRVPLLAGFDSNAYQEFILSSSVTLVPLGKSSGPATAAHALQTTTNEFFTVFVVSWSTRKVLQQNIYKLLSKCNNRKLSKVYRYREKFIDIARNFNTILIPDIVSK